MGVTFETLVMCGVVVHGFARVVMWDVHKGHRVGRVVVKGSRPVTRGVLHRCLFDTGDLTQLSQKGRGDGGRVRKLDDRGGRGRRW